jgi:flagellar basal body P-ring formation protein FlgA
MHSFIAALFFIAVPATLGAQPTPELGSDELSHLTQRFLADAARLDFANADVRITVDAPDARLRFPACANLTMTPHGQRGFGRTSVTVRCEAPQPWAASLTATIEVWRPVAVAAHALAGQAALQPNDIVMESRNLADLHDQYVDSSERIVGWTTRRPIAPGAVLNLRQLVAPIAVAKGDEVRIRAGLGAVAVSMNGIALDSGMPGEQIAVRNVQSSRVIKAWVVAPGLVTTGPKP